MQKKFLIYIAFLSLIFSIFIFRVSDLAYANHEKYVNKYNSITNIYVSGSSAPRGRILDINGKVLVDNIGINTIMYHKPNYITLEEELEVAEKLVELTDYKYEYNENKLKEFYLLKYKEECEKLITDTEKKLYSERKLTKKELEKYKLERITESMLDSLTELEKYSSYFYYLMQEGYIYDNKLLLKNIDEELYAKILETNLTGIFGSIDWKRDYKYGNTLKTIFGEISNSLPKEKDDLLNNGYSYDDKVGISGLEEYYEEYLKGEKAKYKIENNNLKLIKNAKRGNDLVLEIDINLQLEVEKIMKNQIEQAKKMPNTEFYRESYALVSDPSSGAMRAIAGIRRLDNGEFQDVSINIIKNAYTVGSAVKAASLTVGYQNNIIDIGTRYNDSCVKLANLPAKCSYRRLGVLDDKRALALSSNYYQFMIALGISGNKYSYNMKAKVSESDFETYRETFKKFGLGTKTGIDLPGELEGFKGSQVAIDLLLNLSIGQYDLYTPVGLLQYINTIGNNGSRLKLNIMHSIKSEDEVIYENKIEELNKIDLEEKYLKRIQESLREVMRTGTGYWYASPKTDAAGKTGTSESWIDSNLDGKMDSFVLSHTFLMYAPFDNPKYSMVVISPNISNINGKTNYRAQVNRLIARDINDFLLSNE